MTGSHPRIVSLLPSATEIVCALGLRDALVGVTHECDFPSSVMSKPHVTSSIIESSRMTPAQIDAAVRDSLAQDATIYHLDGQMLEELRPDLIFTQNLCDVCAVGPQEVQSVIASLSFAPQVVSLEPQTLAQVLDSIRTVGALTHRKQEAAVLLDDLQTRIQGVRQAVADVSPVPVLSLEWIAPVFVGGHWVPEMIELAGGRDVLGTEGRPSVVAAWESVAASAPQVVVAMLCGFDLQRSAHEMASYEFPGEWHALAAVRNGEVWATDGSAYFSRPGPRLVDGIEILASILHPDRFHVERSNGYARASSAVEVIA